jgi:hypothetical protein
LRLRVFGRSDELGEMGGALERQGAARHVALAPGVDPGYALVTADIDGGAADAVLTYLLAHGVAQDDIALARVDDVASIVHAHPDPALIWDDVLWQARRNARPVARYLVFMMVAGVIAGFGVIYASTTLIVGAMAAQPRHAAGRRGDPRRRDARQRRGRRGNLGHHRPRRRLPRRRRRDGPGVKSLGRARRPRGQRRDAPHRRHDHALRSTPVGRAPKHARWQRHRAHRRVQLMTPSERRHLCDPPPVGVNAWCHPL